MRAVEVKVLAQERIHAAKSAFTTRRVPPEAMHVLLSGPIRPRSGDLVLAVIERIGQHASLELPSGRKATLHIGDEIIVAYADRYAPDQFEAHVPINLGVTQLVASGGVASHVLSRHESLRLATRIKPVGLIADARGVTLNVNDFRLDPAPVAQTRPRTIAVVGTSMNSGKTTTNRYLVNGLSRGGHRPGAAKVTGTGSGGDYWIMMDAGAQLMLDFTDVGFASTYRIPMFAIERAYLELLDHLTDANCGVLLVEVADGIYQQETARLIDSAPFRESVDGIIFAAGDAMGAAHGVESLQRMGLPVIAVSGRLTASPLALREARQACGVPVLTSYQLRDPEEAARIVGLSSQVEDRTVEDEVRPALSIVEPALASSRS